MRLEQRHRDDRGRMNCRFADTDDGRLKCLACGRLVRKPASGKTPRAACKSEPRKPQHWLTCPHRGDVLATVTGRAAGCGCGSTSVDVFQCERFTEPVLVHAAERCGDAIREAVPAFTGRTCRACRPLPERFDAATHLARFPYHAVSNHTAAVACHFNPHGSEARRRCWGLFAQQFPLIGLELFVAEASLDGRFEIPSGLGVLQLDLDPDACLFAKENLLNIAIDRLPDRFDRVLWIDSDVLMLPHDYADRLADALDRHRAVQAFRELRYLGPNGEPETGWRPSLGWSNARAGTSSANHHAGGSYPGLAWAADRQLLADAGGLYDRVVTGGGDVAWATACYGDESVPYMRYWSPLLIADIGRYRERVHPLVPSVGFVDAAGVHLYHGKLASRQYVRRNEILTEVGFDPQTHLDYSPNGTIRWSAAAPGELRQAVRDYMHGRREDET